MVSKPDYSIESEYDGGIIVAIDEAGRGPWAGPVVAGAAIINPASLPDGINDSKLLTRDRRVELYTALRECAQVEVGIASVAEIEKLNILQATKLAMRRAYSALNVKADIVLVDGNQPPGIECNTRCVVKGDSISLSIASASIIAKVTRDRMMVELARAHPGYGWETNVGYGTKQHQDGIAKLGLTNHHRRRWGPIRAILEAQAEADKITVPQMELLNHGK